MSRFTAGERVRVREIDKAGHVRTPNYVRGKAGTIVQFCGTFLDPEELAVGRTGGPVAECYRVEFRQPDLWEGYDGSPEDTLVIELYAHWIATADRPSRRG